MPSYDVASVVSFAPSAPGVQAWLLFGADVAVSLTYLAATYLMIPYTVALCIRRQYLATMFPLHAGKMRRKGKGKTA